MVPTVPTPCWLLERDFPPTHTGPAQSNYLGVGGSSCNGHVMPMINN